MSPASGPSPSPSSPKRMSAPRRRSASASAPIAPRGSRWPSPAKKRPLRKRPARSGSSAAIRASFARSCPRVRWAKRSISPTSRGGATTSVPARTTPGTRASHQSIAPRPKIDHALRRALALAERRQHAACKPRRVAAKLARSLDERHLRAALGEGQRSRQADDASADHGRSHRLTPPHRRRAPRPFRGTRAISRPCRPSPRPPCAGPG